jgi:hypothetical protein
MYMSSFSAALGALKAAKDIAEAMIGLRDATAFQGKLFEFQSKIIDAQNSVFAANDERATLIESERQLKEEVASLKAWDAQKQRYDLQIVPSYHKILAYALKPEAKTSEPPHWLCATCFQNRKASILQPEGRTGATVLVCHECGSDFYTQGARLKDHQSPRKR